MGVMDSEEMDRLRGVPIVDLADVEPERKQTQCLACGWTFDDDAIEWDEYARDVCPYCHSVELRKLG